MKYKVGIVSLGCDKNLIDTEAMLSLLSKEDRFEITNNESTADIIIVNTCGFIESAKQESINTILDLSDYKSNGKCKVLIATGCLAQRYKEKIIEQMPEVDAVVGTGSYHEIAEVINKSLQGEKVLLFGDINNQAFDSERVQSTPSHTAYLKIAEGCDNFCTYCIIPKLRGNYRSRKIENIFEEAKKLVENGVKELIIIAQDTTKYGTDNYGKKMLPELLNKLCTIEKLQWIRLMYCYPEGIDDELIAVIKNQDKICKYLDIPMQHCNNEILKLMGRRSTKEYLVDLINKLRYEIPDITVRTSIIVGFPGETESHFNNLKQCISEMKLDRLGVFAYSREEDTPAAKFENQVHYKTKQKRVNTLMSLQKDISFEKNKKYIGLTFNVLVEEQIDEITFCGRTYKDAPEIDGLVYFKSNDKIRIGEFVNIKITDSEEYDLIGEITDESGK